MSTDRDVTRDLRSWLREDAHEDADRVLGLVLDQLDATPQRRASWPARRFLTMSSNARLGLAAAAIVLAVAVGIGLYSRLSVGTPGPSQSATPTPVALSSPPANLTAGLSYGASSFVAPFTFSVPASGWKVAVSRASQVDVYAHARSNYGLDVRANILVYADPCHWDLGYIADSQSLGTVDGIVAALTSVPGFTATQPVATTVAGHAGFGFDLTPPADAGQCTTPGFLRLLNAGEPGIEDQFPLNVHLHYDVIDVGGMPVLFEQYSFDDASRLAEVQQVLDTVTFP